MTDLNGDTDMHSCHIEIDSNGDTDMGSCHIEIDSNGDTIMDTSNTYFHSDNDEYDDTTNNIQIDIEYTPPQNIIESSSSTDNAFVISKYIGSKQYIFSTFPRIFEVDNTKKYGYTNVSTKSIITPIDNQRLRNLPIIEKTFNDNQYTWNVSFHVLKHANMFSQTPINHDTEITDNHPTIKFYKVLVNQALKLGSVVFTDNHKTIPPKYYVNTISYIDCNNEDDKITIQIYINNVRCCLVGEWNNINKKLIIFSISACIRETNGTFRKCYRSYRGLINE
jgi:hypothetical protein